MRDKTELGLTALTRREVGQPTLNEVAAELLALFARREEEFAFSSCVAIDYPAIGASGASAFVSDPVAYVDARRAALNMAGTQVARTVLLTTFGDRVTAPLVTAGFRHSIIDMPGGPQFTCWFDRVERSANGVTLYVEAVDEADERIQPAFALTLRDAGGTLRGGACGAIHTRDGKHYCYLSTMALDAGLAPATGLKLGIALLSFLRGEGVHAVHLGTQTARAFMRS